jgi:hypothetical protein
LTDFPGEFFVRRVAAKRGGKFTGKRHNGDAKRFPASCKFKRLQIRAITNPSNYKFERAQARLAPRVPNFVRRAAAKRGGKFTGKRHNGDAKRFPASCKFKRLQIRAITNPSNYKFERTQARFAPRVPETAVLQRVPGAVGTLMPSAIPAAVPGGRGGETQPQRNLSTFQAVN